MPSVIDEPYIVYRFFPAILGYNSVEALLRRRPDQSGQAILSVGVPVLKLPREIHYYVCRKQISFG